MRIAHKLLTPYQASVLNSLAIVYAHIRGYIKYCMVSSGLEDSIPLINLHFFSLPNQSHTHHNTKTLKTM